MDQRPTPSCHLPICHLHISKGLLIEKSCRLRKKNREEKKELAEEKIEIILKPFICTSTNPR